MEQRWELRNWSKIFREYPDIQLSAVSARARLTHRYLVNNEGTRTLQELTRLRMTAAGTDAALVHTDGPLQADEAATASATQYMNLRKLSIFGGSNEIQRGVIAKTILGL